VRRFLTVLGVLGVLAALAGEDLRARRIFGWVLVAGLLAYWDFPRDRLMLALVTAVLLYVELFLELVPL
jgi:type II secretory pathway component PulM